MNSPNTPHQLHIVNFCRQVGVMSDGHGGLKPRNPADYLKGVKVKPSTKFPNLHLCKYDQIEVEQNNLWDIPYVQEARGIILDSANNWNPVCMTYAKFFNMGQAQAHPVDWSKSIVYEKLDGSLMQLWHYSGAWHVSTSGTPDADCPVGDHGVTFGHMFWETFNKQGIQLDALDPNYCYAFELMGPLNRIVVAHPEPKLVLHGVRDMRTLQELDPALVTAGRPEFGTIKTWKVSDQESLQALVASFNGAECEGVVVCDMTQGGIHFARQKVKNLDYLRLHRMVSATSKASLALTARMRDGDELLAYFPSFKPDYDKIVRVLDEAEVTAEACWQVHKGLLVNPEPKLARKNYAIALKKDSETAGIQGYLFQRASDPGLKFTDWVMAMPDSTYVDWVTDRSGGDLLYQAGALTWLRSHGLCAQVNLHTNPDDIIGGLTSFQDDTLKCTVFQDAFQIIKQDGRFLARVTGPGNLSSECVFDSQVAAAVWVVETMFNEDFKDMVEALDYLRTGKVGIHRTDAEAIRIEGGISPSETSFNISLVNEDAICRVLVCVSGHGINDRYYCKSMRSAAELVVDGYKAAGLLMSKSGARLQAKMIELMESTCGTSRPIMVSPTASARLILDHLKSMTASELADAVYGASAPVEAIKPPTYVRPPRYDELFFGGPPAYDGTLEDLPGLRLKTEGGSNDD